MRMYLQRANQLIRYSLFLMIVVVSCNNQRSPVKEPPSTKVSNDSTLLKFTSAVRAILEDSKGDTWFGSYSEGAALWHKGQWRYFTTANGLSNNQVRNIYEDTDGLIWFECGKGLSVYDGKQMTVYTKKYYDAPTQWRISGKDRWFKGDETEGYNSLEKHPGLYQYDGQTLFYRQFPVTSKTGDGFKYNISTPYVKRKNGSFWFGCYSAIIGFDGSGFTILDAAALGLDTASGSLHVRSIFEDSKGRLWIGNNGIGVLLYDGKKTIRFTEEQQLRKADTQGNTLDRVFSIGEDTTGNMWFGTRDYGLWRYDGKTMKNFTKSDGLASPFIWTIYKSKKGDLWFGGDNPGGVYRFNGKSFERIY